VFASFWTFGSWSSRRVVCLGDVFWRSRFLPRPSSRVESLGVDFAFGLGVLRGFAAFCLLRLACRLAARFLLLEDSALSGLLSGAWGVEFFVVAGGLLFLTFAFLAGGDAGEGESGESGGCGGDLGGLGGSAFSRGGAVFARARRFGLSCFDGGSDSDSASDSEQVSVSDSQLEPSMVSVTSLGAAFFLMLGASFDLAASSGLAAGLFGGASANGSRDGRVCVTGVECVRAPLVTSHWRAASGMVGGYVGCVCSRGRSTGLCL